MRPYAHRRRDRLPLGLTYDNALVWRVLLLLSEWLERPDLAAAPAAGAAVHRYWSGGSLFGPRIWKDITISTMNRRAACSFCRITASAPWTIPCGKAPYAPSAPRLSLSFAGRPSRKSAAARAASLGAVHLQQPALRPCGHGAGAPGPHPHGQRPGLRKRQRGHGRMRNRRGFRHLRGISGLRPVERRALTAGRKQGMIAMAGGRTKDETLRSSASDMWDSPWRCCCRSGTM